MSNALFRGIISFLHFSSVRKSKIGEIHPDLINQLNRNSTLLLEAAANMSRSILDPILALIGQNLPKYDLKKGGDSNDNTPSNPSVVCIVTESYNKFEFASVLYN